MGWMFQHDRFLTQEVSSQLRQLSMLKRPSKILAEYSQKLHNRTSRGRSTETSNGLAAIQAQLNNLGREIKKNRTLMYETRQTMIPFLSHLNGYYSDGKKRSYGPQFSKAYSKASYIDESIPQKEKDPGRASVSVMPLLTYLNLRLGELTHTKLTVELAERTVKYPKGIAENILVRIGKFTFPVDFIILDMLEDIKVPLIHRRPFLSTARAKINVYKRKNTLRVGEENIIFKSVKPASSLIKRVYMLSLRERMELDLEARLMGETLVINRSLDPLNGDYIELNDLNEPFELNRNQGDDLMSTIKEGEFNNSIMKEKLEYKGNNFVGALMNVPIFVGTFFVVTDFAILEDMDVYRDEGMGDVIVGEPFLREVGIKARRFNGMITIYNGDDEVTYQMVQSHPRFKHHTNEQCNKIPPLLKMTTLAKHIIVAGAENRPPMLEKSMYDSWASRIRLFIKGKKHDRMMLDSIDNGPLVYLTVEENG
ncbi:hypothetical protein Tco_0842875 [Tanacetum coccineum]|uniref:Reverse transcriptase domain-containing protein n=1 Tax=Tanacetum coccineum TaxID=301880 RepID=A0ABQ5B3R5_9ASTR